MTLVDRIPLAIRLRRPADASAAAFLAAEHRRAGGAHPAPDARCELELAHEAGAMAVADRRVARMSRRLRRLAAAGLRRVGYARSNLAAVAGADSEVVRWDGRAETVAAVRIRARVAAVAHDADRTVRRLDRSSRTLRFVGFGLLLVDAAALLVIFGYLLNVDWVRPDPANLVTVLALSVFGAAVQAVLALHLGRRLWAWRHADVEDDGADEFPPRSAVVVLGGGLLTLVSTFAAGALFLRVQLEGAVVDAGSLATALGLLLGASALAAPWCLVADEAYGPGPDARCLREVGRILRRADRTRRRRARRARRHLGRAEFLLRRAEWQLAAAVHGVGRDHLPAHRRLLMARGLAWGGAVCTAEQLRVGAVGEAEAWSVLPMPVAGDHRCLTRPVETLRFAVAEATAQYAAVVDELSIADLDLAG